MVAQADTDWLREDSAYDEQHDVTMPWGKEEVEEEVFSESQEGESSLHVYGRVGGKRKMSCIACVLIILEIIAITTSRSVCGRQYGKRLVANPFCYSLCLASIL